MTHCKIGPEICVYEFHRIEMLGVGQWNDQSIEIKEFTHNNLN